MMHHGYCCHTEMGTLGTTHPCSDHLAQLPKAPSMGEPWFWEHWVVGALPTSTTLQSQSTQRARPASSPPAAHRLSMATDTGSHRHWEVAELRQPCSPNKTPSLRKKPQPVGPARLHKAPICAGKTAPHTPRSGCRPHMGSSLIGSRCSSQQPPPLPSLPIHSAAPAGELGPPRARALRHHTRSRLRRGTAWRMGRRFWALPGLESLRTPSSPLQPLGQTHSCVRDAFELPHLVQMSRQRSEHSKSFGIPT